MFRSLGCTQSGEESGRTQQAIAPMDLAPLAVVRQPPPTSAGAAKMAACRARRETELDGEVAKVGVAAVDEALYDASEPLARPVRVHRQSGLFSKYTAQMEARRADLSRDVFELDGFSQMRIEKRASLIGETTPTGRGIGVSLRRAGRRL
jgi:hypothetical protein